MGEPESFHRGETIISSNKPMPRARRSSTFHNEPPKIDFMRQPSKDAIDEECCSSSNSFGSDINQEIDTLKQKIEVIGENQKKQQQSIELILSKFDNLINNQKELYNKKE